MKEVTFTGSLSEVQKRAEEWKASNPHAKVIDDGPPISVGNWAGQVESEGTAWFITVKYEDQPSSSPFVNIRSRYRIVPIGGPGSGWGLEVDGIIRRSSPRAVVLAAYVDAVLAGASEDDAGYIAAAIERRPCPSFEERMAVYSATGQPPPSRDPYKRSS